VVTDEVAMAASTGLVVIRDGAVEWLNDAARDLVTTHGGTWSGQGSPIEVLAAVLPGARRTPTRWPSTSGGARWWQVSASALPGAVLYEVTDETDRYGADGRDTGPPTAQWRLTRLERLAGQGSWVWNLETGAVEYSETLMTMFGWELDKPLDGETVLETIHPDDRDQVRAIVRAAVRDRAPFSYVARVFTDPARRTERIFDCHGEVFCDAEGVPTRLMAVLRDVTEQHRDRAELAFLAEHDPLTGVANRRRIGSRIADCAADARGGSLLMIDIDNLKDINDLRGHAVGDLIIRRVASTVAAQIGPEALLGRLGGDEFAVILPASPPAEALALAERLCDVVAVASVVDPTLHVTVSIGVAQVAPGQPADVALAQADLAVYAAKGAGRNRARLFSDELYLSAARRVSLLQRVEAALEEGTMRLFAQPIVDLATGVAGRHELLIRLRDGLEPPLGPADFLPAAERTDLVHELDRWVLQRAVRALANPRAQAAGLRLEVNISARSLENPDLGRWILELLKEAEVNPQRLGLEITETTAIDSLDAARLLATRLTEAGCGFALDDFGAGYGSFTYLKHLPFTTVKIAGEFVRQVDDDAVDRALVTAVVGVAHQLGMRTVAEQVDRATLVTHLRALGVDDGQGFHLGRPRSLDTLLDRI
jgi:diguanylate cyclase (GGDEF)-like protein/PAS domain S-box-containing protein